MFHQDFQTSRSGLKNTRCSRVFLNDVEVFEGETLFRVLDKASQTDR